MTDLLEFSFIYNLRFIVAGSQQLTKDFIKKNYEEYGCKSVLDLGCGTGDFASIFSPQEYLGIDSNNRYIRYATLNRPNYRFKCANILTYKFGNRSFDAALFISVMHHLGDKEIEEILRIISEKIKKIVIIVDLNPETTLIKKILIKLDRGHHIRTTDEKKKLLSMLGRCVKIAHFSTGLASQTGIVLILQKKR